MTTDRPRLYPGHRHQWTDAGIADPLQQNRQIVRCTVCDFTVPRSLANLDGAMLNDTDHDEPDTEHRHMWTDAEPELFTKGFVRCRICEHTAPRSIVNLDGTEPDTDIRCKVHKAIPGTRTEVQCLDHQGHLGEHQYPQEIR